MDYVHLHKTPLYKMGKSMNHQSRTLCWGESGHSAFFSQPLLGYHRFPCLSTVFPYFFAFFIYLQQ